MKLTHYYTPSYALLLILLACGRSVTPPVSVKPLPVPALPVPANIDSLQYEDWSIAETDELFMPHVQTFLEEQKERRWIDSVYNNMSDDARIGQLFMLRAHSNKGEAYEQMVADLVRRIQPGGLCFFQGAIVRQAELTNHYQALSKTPMMIAMDAEFGLGMRLSDGITYPRQMTLGAIRDDEAVYRYGREMARQCRRLGVNVSFSPSVDINNNPANPVINDRSFGDDRYNVAAKSARYMKGLQDGGVLASAKHFPGHGDTDKDSHYALPVISHDLRRLDSIELFPFKNMIKSGVGSIMVAHLNIPALESDPRLPSTLSHTIITRLLRQKMHYDGLIFTDAMEMKAVADSFPPGVADVRALLAGNDMVLLPVNPDSALTAIGKALADGTYSRQQFERSVRRILRAKYRLGLTTPQHIDLTDIKGDINTPDAYQLKRDLYRQALTLVRDRDSIAGIGDQLYLRIGKTRSTLAADSSLRTLKIASLALGDTNLTVFQQHCSRYAAISHFGTDTMISPEQMQALLDTLQQYDLVLASHHKTRSKARDNYGLTRSEIELVHRLNALTPVALTVFGNPYSIRHFDAIPALMVAYTEDPVAQETAAEAWFGAANISGRLPVQVSAGAAYQQGKLCIFPDKRLSYDLPEAVGMDSDTLAQIDALAEELIRNGAAPGCQILVAKAGKIIWNKAYGHYTYEQTRPMTTATMFDLASITKVAATTLSVMKLADQRKLNVSRPLSDYLPELRSTNKSDLKINDILAHQAGLQAWIAFYKKTLDAQNRPLPALYSGISGTLFSTPVAPGLWMKSTYTDTIWQTIFQSELRPDRNYKYSDLTMYLMARTVERLTSTRLDEYVYSQFYAPMGLSYTMYTPWKYGYVEQCAPTEQDNYFRYQTLQGYVHDMGAAMLGGVSGHAGLFGTTNDLAKIFQMLLNGGHYGGTTYFSPETVRLFTTRHTGSSRRGLGFDMKETDPKATVNMSDMAGINTFGHTGFTGNAVWADPDQQLIFVFLSNRTFPTMDNNKLIDQNFRPRIQSVVYKAIKSSPK